MDLINKLIVGDSLNSLRKLPEGFVDCVVTSPPYWALRNYGTNPVEWPDGWIGELGLEPSFEQYITHLCDIFDEIKRTLKNSGTCWVNIGDTYGGNWMGLSNIRHLKNRCNKSLLLIPFRFALEMQNRGWKVRNVIIWQKPNCTPQSMKDRFTVDFEYLFFFVKSDKYYFEQQLEPFKESSIKRCQGGCSRNKGERYQGLSKKNYDKYQQKVLNGEVKGKNKRAVWNIPTSPFRGAHFAVYPRKLIETPIKAGCPEGGLVLDPFMGSGTTALVAEKLNRNWFGIELNPEYARMAEGRLYTAREKQNAA